MIRASILFVVVGMLAAGVLYDRVDAPAVVDTGVSADPIVTPSMREPARLDSAWFCPVGSSSSDGYADHTIEISNLGDEPAQANVGVLSANGNLANQRIELAPKSTHVLVLSSVVESDAAGAVVEIVGGIGVVGHTVQTAHGPAEGPCATSVSNTWYFASGRTTRDSKEYLVLMNPFPEDAVFSVEFYRSAGRPSQREDLQGAVVPGNSVRRIEIDTFVRREETVATSITTLRGRLVAERLQVVNGDLGPSGAALELGATGPAESWMLPGGRVHEGGSNQVIVFNPSAEEAATVDIELWPENPTDRSLYGLTAIPRELLPGRFEIIDLDNEADRFGLLLPYELGVSVTSTNAVPVVVERWHFAAAGEEAPADEGAGEEGAGEEAPAEEGAGEEAPAEEGAGEEAPAEEEGTGEAAAGDPMGAFDVPGIFGGEAQELFQASPDTGLATSRGTEVLSERWVFPWISTPTPESSVVVVTAPEDATVEVTAFVNGVEEGPFRATVPAGGRAVIPLSITAGGAPVIVDADVPVSAEAQVVNLGTSYATVAGAPTLAG
jgi:hypothetical protein